MTTDTAPEAPDATESDRYADAECNNCGGSVVRRRPSLTGAHFCTKQECQRAKHRFYYRRRADGTIESDAKRATQHQLMLVNFVGAVAHADRADCDTCGRPEVIPGYAHPVPDWSAACNPVDRLPVSGDPALTTALMKAIYPPIEWA